MEKQTSKSLPFFFVGKTITDTRKSNFATTKHSILSAALGREDTLSIWYTREHIAKLLEEIDLAGGDGLRVYLGAYESEHEFSGQLCLVMNATREQTISGEARHVDVILENEPNFTTRSAKVEASGTKTKDYNFGSPCPPRCT